MTLENFAKLVSEMRHWQTEYFRTRSPAAMAKAKRLELEVDEALREMFDKQQKMF